MPREWMQFWCRLRHNKKIIYDGNSKYEFMAPESEERYKTKP